MAHFTPLIASAPGYGPDTHPLLKRLKNRAKSIRRDAFALTIALRDPRVPGIAKLLIALVAAYAFSPIDLIPDFIPLVGYLDDLILLPLAIALTIKMIPKEVWSDCRSQAEARLSTTVPANRRAAVVIIVIWLLLLGSVALLIARYLSQVG